MQFNLIGSFEITTDDGRIFAPKAPKICQMLAVLALQPREVVAKATLIRELWGEDPPGGALRTLQTHVYHARRMLSDAHVVGPGRRLLLTQAPGYRLDIADDEVDVRTFERFIRRAQGELSHGTPERASEHLDRALALWRGPVLSSAPIGDVLTGRIAHVEELKIRALELRVETENRLGRFREFLPELRNLVNEYPLHEWFHEQLIVALHRSGRRGEALEAYRNLYYVLRQELGLEPSAEIQRLQAQILNAAPGDVPLRLHTRRDSRADRPTPPLWASSFAS